jgi:hypothetical protein
LRGNLTNGGISYSCAPIRVSPTELLFEEFYFVSKSFNSKNNRIIDHSQVCLAGSPPPFGCSACASAAWKGLATKAGLHRLKTL